MPPHESSSAAVRMTPPGPLGPYIGNPSNDQPIWGEWPSAVGLVASA